ASRRAKKGAFVRGKRSPRLAVGALFHMVTDNGFAWDCSMPLDAQQMYVHPNSAAMFPLERVFYGFCQAAGWDSQSCTYCGL
ncbi:MAG TPA: hypothetical protein VEX37_06845, partial [Thermomicrobiales bacterium]|nr:hypothetical protein [Thermomicrobiales bacterium]